MTLLIQNIMDNNDTSELAVAYVKLITLALDSKDDDGIYRKLSRQAVVAKALIVAMVDDEDVADKIIDAVYEALK